MPPVRTAPAATVAGKPSEPAARPPRIVTGYTAG